MMILLTGGHGGEVLLDGSAGGSLTEALVVARVFQGKEERWFMEVKGDLR